MLSRRLVPFLGGTKLQDTRVWTLTIHNVYPTSIHPCREKKKKGKAFALVARKGQQMLKSFTFLEESKQKASEEAASTKMKAERGSFLLEA